MNYIQCLEFERNMLENQRKYTKQKSTSENKPNRNPLVLMLNMKFILPLRQVFECLVLVKISKSSLVKSIPYRTSNKLLHILYLFNRQDITFWCQWRYKSSWSCYKIPFMENISINIQKWSLIIICYFSIWDRFKVFKTSDTGFNTRLPWRY